MKIDDIPLWQFGLRVALVAIEILLVLLVGQTGALFFYQGF